MYDDYEYYEGEDYNVWEDEQVFQDEVADRLADEEDALADFEYEYGDLPSCPSRRRRCAEYDRGVAEARLWQAERRIYGDELADEWELEREMRDPDPYY